MLRKVIYEVIEGNGPGWVSESGDVLSLLCHCPFFFMAKVIPPMQVLNEFLQGGGGDQSLAVGSCRWKSFQLDSTEYLDLVAELKRDRFKTITAPHWASTCEDWNIWCGEIVWGIPALQRRQLRGDISALTKKMDEAYSTSDFEVVASLLKQILDLNTEEARFIGEHRSAEPKLTLVRQNQIPNG